MKLLHLADLHIGKSVNGFSMIEDQRHIFHQIIAYVRTEQPDVILIAGDVYDRTVPGIEAVRLLDDFLTQLAALKLTVFLIAGNHDSPERLSFGGRLLSEHHLHLCGTFDGRLQPITLQDAYGPVHFWLLPFIKPSGIRGLFDDSTIESYTDAVQAALDAAAINPSERNVLLSHQFYTGTGLLPIRSESEINPVGGLDAVDAGLLSEFDYVALGHLHGPQAVGTNIRYAGSPLKYSFSEWKHQKSIPLVELRAKGDVAVQLLPLTPLRELREIKGTLEQLTRPDVVAQGNPEDYLRVILTDEEDLIDPLGKIRSVYPNVMALDFENTHTLPDILPGVRTEALSPLELFSDFYLEMAGTDLTEAQLRIVRALLETEAEQ